MPRWVSSLSSDCQQVGESPWPLKAILAARRSEDISDQLSWNLRSKVTTVDTFDHKLGILRNVRFQPQTRQTRRPSPQQLALTASSLAPRASHIHLTYHHNKYIYSHQGRARGALRYQILPTPVKSTCPKGTFECQSFGKSPRHHRW